MSKVSLTTFMTHLSEIKASAEKNFDPVRLAYFDSLAQRLREPRHAENHVLIERAYTSVRQYRDDYVAERDMAIETLSWFKATHPNELPQADAFFNAAAFKKLATLRARLESRSNIQTTQAGLKELVNGINQQRLATDQGNVSHSFDDVLRSQETQVLQEADLGVDKPESRKDGRGEQLELQSMKVFRESLKYVDIDQLISRAINECPQNPGPHNPQMLAVTALMQMRDLSPQYLRRFAAYIESMLWVEKNAAKLSAKKAPS